MHMHGITNPHIDCPCLHSYLLIFTCLCSLFIHELSDVWLTYLIPIPLFKLKFNLWLLLCHLIFELAKYDCNMCCDGTFNKHIVDRMGLEPFE